jgi:AraC-like DNA-binding protein
MYSATQRHISCLDQHPLINTNNFEDAREKISKMVSPHKIEMASRRDSANVQFSGIELNGISLMHASYGCAVKAELEDNDFFYTHTILHGTSEVRCNGNEHYSTEGDSVILSPSVNYKMHLHENCDRIVMRIEKEKIENHLSGLLNAEINKELVFTPEIRDSASWENTIKYILDQIESSPEVLKSKTIMNAYSTIIFSSLVELNEHNFRSLLVDDQGSTNPPKLCSALEFIEAKIKDNIAVIDIAKHCNVSVRTLQRSFLSQLNVSPNQYVRDTKLKAIHEEFNSLSGDKKGAVKRILLDYGIVDFGRFTQYYREKFGCTPSQTLSKR